MIYWNRLVTYWTVSKSSQHQTSKPAEPAEVRPSGQVEGLWRGRAMGWTKSQDMGALVLGSLLTCHMSQGGVSLDTHISHIKQEVWRLHSQKTHLVLRLIFLWQVKEGNSVLGVAGWLESTPQRDLSMRRVSKVRGGKRKCLAGENLQSFRHVGYRNYFKEVSTICRVKERENQRWKGARHQCTDSSWRQYQVSLLWFPLSQLGHSKGA